MRLRTAREQMLAIARERDFQQQIVDAARWLGWLVYHVFDSRRSEPGFPDLVMVHPRQRRVLFVELKSETGRLRPEQLIWLGALMSCPGVEAYVWRPGDVDEAMALLEGSGERCDATS